jgi:preflagellin peptidase FlaK
MEQILDIARIVSCLVFLFYASWKDYETREVSNKVWIILGPLGLIITVLEFVFISTGNLMTYLISFAIISILGLIVFYAGGFGGADAKALICIGLILPIYPSQIRLEPRGLLSPVFPLTIFTNSVIFGALSVFYTLFRNLTWIVRKKDSIFEGLNESLWNKILALISGYKVKLKKLKKGHMYPIEDFEINEAGEKKRKLLVYPNYEERDEIIGRLQQNIPNRESEVWVTPGLPFLIFITIGLIVALIYGDIIWIILSSIIT